MIRNSQRNIQLVSIISKNPGIKFREIMRETGMKNGVLSHYLGKLEKSGSVQVQRESRQTRFYPLHVTLDESKIIKALRRTTPRDIIYSLMLSENLEFNEIVKKISKAPSTVSLYLSQLVEDGIIKIHFLERKKTYKLNNKILVDKLIERYHPNTIERATAGLEDIINSL